MEVTGVVVVDPGHGGIDTGAVGRTDNTVLEKDLALAYGLKLRDELIDKFKDEKRGLKVVMTRETTEGFLSLQARSQLAKTRGADVLVSIHFNHADAASARGTETFVEHTPENKNPDDDADLAASLQQSTVSSVQSQDAGGAHRTTFENNWVLRDGVPIPGVKRAGFAVTKDRESYNGNTENYRSVKACLIEVEFLSNETALDSVKLSGSTGETIKNSFAEAAATDIFNNVLNQP